MAMDQKAAFADRLNRIKAGQQFEHADLVGHQTQVAYKKIHGDKARKPKRTPVEKLMEELKKISRIIEREYPEAYRETLLVLDATTGQNAISQAKLFKEAADINGLVLTKLDGTAKGGIIIAIKSELDIPVKLIGVGEKVNDLQEFSASDFVNALFDENE